MLTNGAQVICENKSAVLPHFTVAQSIFKLPVLHFLQGGHNKGGNADGTAFAVLCGYHLILSPAAPDQL